MIFEVDLGSTDYIEEHDAVIVGGGAAGLRSAISLAERGISPIILTKTTVDECATAWAQGGLAAVEPPDSFESHAQDTLKAGHYCDPLMVREMVQQAPAVIDELRSWGMPFSPVLHHEGGHAVARVYNTGDGATGAAMHAVLLTRAKKMGIKITEHFRAVDILTNGTAACGIRVQDENGRIGELLTNIVVLATGGIGRIFGRTTNPVTATGDGLAMAIRAGARTKNMRYVQFHPTVLDSPSGVLISEAVRGAGAVIELFDGTTIPLAPRDIVSAAIWKAGGHAILNCEKVDWTQFPAIARQLEGYDLDRIPIAPGAHYHCGGVVANIDGSTSIDGLYAVGEVACTGLHGSNRLASNSLTEAVTMGRLVATGLNKNHEYTKPTPRARVMENLDACNLRLAKEAVGQQPWML